MDLVKLQQLLVRHEGFRSFPYLDTVGKITIGIGHNLTDKGLKPAQILTILDDDIIDTLGFIRAHLPWFSDLDDVRQVAVADMVFNLMGKTLGFVKMLDALQHQQWDLAADELLSSKFAAQTGQRATELAQILRTGIM